MTEEKKFSIRRMRKDIPVVVKNNTGEMYSRYDTITEYLREVGDEISQKTAGEIWKRLRDPNPKPISVNDSFKSLDTTNRAPALKNGKIEFCDYFAYVKSFKKDARYEKVLGLFSKEFAGLVAERAPMRLYPVTIEKTHEIINFLNKG